MRVYYIYVETFFNTRYIIILRIQINLPVLCYCVPNWNFQVLVAPGRDLWPPFQAWHTNRSRLRSREIK